MRWVEGLRRSAFVFLVAVIGGIGSERVFWFWSPDAVDHLVVALVYSLPAGVLLWAIDRYRVTGPWSLMLALPLYGYVTEGVITPVLYSGGPFVPFFPVWFTFWHGIFAAGLLVFAIRRWLLVGDRGALIATAVGLGVFWGTWSTTMWLPENVNDPDLIADQGGPLHVLSPLEFAQYAATFTAILMAGHFLLGFVWPRRFTPSRPTKMLWFGAIVAVVVAWTFAIFWALPMFVAYVGLQVWGLRRHGGAGTGGPTLFEQLDGRVALRALMPLALTAPVAALTYGAWWWVNPLDGWLNIVMYGTIFIQTIAGGVWMVRSLRRAGRAAPVAPEPVPRP